MQALQPTGIPTQMAQDLQESIESGIATLTMNRPEARNALTRDMMFGLVEALPRLAADPAVRLVVLTGAGKAFCSGGDVKSFAKRAAGTVAQMSFDQQVTDVRARMEVSRYLHEMPKPTLAVIPGAAAGAGLSLALACDMRIAARVTDRRRRRRRESPPMSASAFRADSGSLPCAHARPSPAGQTTSAPPCRQRVWQNSSRRHPNKTLCQRR